MQKYPKIQSIFKRDERGRFTEDFSTPEIEYLAGNQWVWTEKVDGTNVRVHWDGLQVRFGGRDDNTQLSIPFFEYLQETFAMPAAIERFRTATPVEDEPVILFGEGYGKGIQKGGVYLPDSVGFILFDVLVGRWWLKRETVEEIAEGLDIPCVSVVGQGTLAEAIEFVQHRPESALADTTMEGLVLRPAVELFGRNGDRVITKIKVKDMVDRDRRQPKPEGE